MVSTSALPVQGQQLADLFAEINALFMAHPHIMEVMPEDFLLIPLPQQDPELANYALSLVPERPEKPVIYALITGSAVIFLLPQGPLQTTLQAA